MDIFSKSKSVQTNQKTNKLLLNYQILIRKLLFPDLLQV